ncbi:MAG TPA: KEOPS complex subunit Cgi121 [Methanolinea sp.]|nr:KEOPS complex subunit Cgi121 [Methanolinea sp.]HQK56321.1 KEOPS complex subunit Cgi121 [Methanolinea sp.]
MLACGISQVRIAMRDLEGFLQKIHGISSRRGTHVIFFNAEHMAGRAHAESALRHAFRALEQETMISNRVEMEALLYAAGSRQIVQGMKFGLHPGENAAYLCICPENEAARKEIIEFCAPADNEDWEVIPPEKAARLCTLFSITPQEIEVVGRGRLPELVLERVALLEVYR